MFIKNKVGDVRVDKFNQSLLKIDALKCDKF